MAIGRSAIKSFLVLFLEKERSFSTNYLPDKSQFSIILLFTVLFYSKIEFLSTKLAKIY